MRPALWLSGALLLCVLAYAPGLSGPFLFDDPPNLIFPLQAWLDGRTGWRDIVFGNHSGMLGRSVAMLTFLGNAAVSGLAVTPFKITNLLIHLACGALIYFLLARLLTRDPWLANRAKVAAAAVAALWLLHPMQVSTVLYVVQRMAQLSTLFTLLALLLYVSGRFALLAGASRKGLALLFLAVPVTIVLAMLSKENGALAPLLCGVIEFGYFRPAAPARRPAAVWLWLAAFVFAPVALVSGWYAWHWQGLVNSYSGRPYTLAERLLSQPRALMDYMSALLLPRGPALGVYTDDFFASHGLLQPPTTLLAIVALTAMIALAWRVRKSVPAVAVGIGLYLAAHAMESSVFPLLLYFEHRNYLPSVGFFLALVGALAWLAPKVVARSDRPARFARLLGGAALLAFALLTLATAARARVWSSFPLLATQGARQHPQSMRAQLDYAHALQLAGQNDAAHQVFEYMLTMRSPQARHVGAINRVTLDCMVHGSTSAAHLAYIDTIGGATLQLGEMLAFENLGKWLEEHSCEGLAPEELAAAMVQILDAAPQPQGHTAIWRSRYVAARLFARVGDLQRAKNQAALAWMTNATDVTVGLFLADLYLHSREPDHARLLLDAAEKRTPSFDQRNRDAASRLRQRLEQQVE